MNKKQLKKKLKKAHAEEDAWEAMYEVEVEHYNKLFKLYTELQKQQQSRLTPSIDDPVKPPWNITC